MLPFKRIVCPVDLSEPSFAALDTADDLAVRFEAELWVVHVVPPVHPQVNVPVDPTVRPTDSSCSLRASCTICRCS